MTIIETACQSDLQTPCFIFYFLFVDLKLMLSCKYPCGLAGETCSKWSSGSFICTAAVYSGELAPLNLQLCGVVKVRNSNLSLSQTVQIVPDSENTGNIGWLFPMWIKACNGRLCSAVVSWLFPCLRAWYDGRQSTSICVKPSGVTRCTERLSTSFQTTVSSWNTPPPPPSSLTVSLWIRGADWAVWLLRCWVRSSHTTEGYDVIHTKAMGIGHLRTTSQSCQQQ